MSHLFWLPFSLISFSRANSCAEKPRELIRYEIKCWRTHSSGVSKRYFFRIESKIYWFSPSVFILGVIAGRLSLILLVVQKMLDCVLQTKSKKMEHPCLLDGCGKISPRIAFGIGKQN